MEPKIKVLNKEFTYFESEQKIELEINGKKIVAFRYEKQDPKFSDYDLDVEIQNEELLSEEEIEEIEEFVKNELNENG